MAEISTITWRQSSFPWLHSSSEILAAIPSYYGNRRPTRTSRWDSVDWPAEEGRPPAAAMEMVPARARPAGHCTQSLVARKSNVNHVSRGVSRGHNPSRHLSIRVDRIIQSSVTAVVWPQLHISLHMRSLSSSLSSSCLYLYKAAIKIQKSQTHQKHAQRK